MMEIVAPFISDTTGCATALAPASKPFKPDAGGGLAAPPSGRLGADDPQTPSKSSPPLGLGLEGGDWSAFWGQLTAGSVWVGAPVSWQQYSPRNQ